MKKKKCKKSIKRNYLYYGVTMSCCDLSEVGTVKTDFSPFFILLAFRLQTCRTVGFDDFILFAYLRILDNYIQIKKYYILIFSDE